MPRGKFVNHKGRNRHFTSPEELRRSSEDSEENEVDDSTKESIKDKDTDSDPEELSSDLTEATARVEKKGVAALIEIENPNRLSKNTTAQGNGGAVPKPELSRREREEIEKQKARRKYEKLHAQGKTTEAKADLARLALIRQEREAAAAKREAEKKPLAKSLDTQ